MKGYQITFFTVQNQRHKGRPIGDWLVHIANEMGLGGATLIPASEGFGHHRRIHSAHFIELTDQPLEVVMILSAEESERLFERLNREGVRLFYAKTPAEYGMAGAPQP